MNDHDEERITNALADGLSDGDDTYDGKLTPQAMSRAILDKAMTEDQLLSTILEAAGWHGWMAFHVRRSDKAIVQGDIGFPDLVLARKGTVWFIETKRESGRLSELQLAWSQALFPNWYVIRPADLDWLLERLR